MNFDINSRILYIRVFYSSYVRWSNFSVSLLLLRCKHETRITEKRRTTQLRRVHTYLTNVRVEVLFFPKDGT